MDRRAEHVRAAREAMARYAWADAVDKFQPVERDLEADELLAFAEAANWSRRVELALDLRTRAFSAFQAKGDARQAARAAMSIAHTHRSRREDALVSAWTRRAEQLLAQVPECGEHAMLHWMHSMRSSDRNDDATAMQHAERAIELGHQYNDRDVIALSLLRKARVCIKLDRGREAMALVDDAMVSAVAGELETMTTGVVCCAAIDICNELFELDRSSEWTDVTERWCERMSVGGFAGICRIHRAEILRLRGKWQDAEREVLNAADEVRDFRANLVLPEAFYELGEIRLRLGNHEGAAEAFRQAHELGRDPLPGLALLWLEQGRGQAAASKLAQALAELPRDKALKRAKLLPAHVHIAIRLGDLETAVAASDELKQIVADHPTQALQAISATAEGTVLLAKREPGPASQILRRAIQLWTQLDAPFETAQARVVLADSYRLLGDTEAADLELRSARSAFQKLGAVHALSATQPAATSAKDSAAQLSETLAASAPPPSTFAIGSVIDGKLELMAMLGRGGMGVVFAARNRNTGRDVAVKILRRDASADPAACQRMLQEALACGRIQHPNVVDIYDAGSDGGQPYIVMELLRGESLAARIERERKVSFLAAIEIAVQALAGIAAAHSAGIVHRDLKPDNLFLADEPTGLCVKVVDFGISKLAGGASGLASTHTGAVVGTPYYMSPEQATGQKDIDGRTDIYAVGALLFHAITGRPPYLGDNYNALLAAILTTTPPSAASLAPEIPAGLDAALARALSRDPAARQPTAEAFAAELRAAVAASD